MCTYNCVDYVSCLPYVSGCFWIFSDSNQAFQIAVIIIFPSAPTMARVTAELMRDMLTNTARPPAGRLEKMLTEQHYEEAGY